MPSVDTIWTLAITIALAISAGAGFLAWHAPDLWTKLWIASFVILTGVGFGIIVYAAGVDAGLNAALKLNHGKGFGLLQRAADLAGPPAWLLWAINAAEIVGLMLTIIAVYRYNDGRNPKR